jgi:DNA-binding beta-propeller fold protein YncE/mono/diheme cytochrome c family protein
MTGRLGTGLALLALLATTQRVEAQATTTDWPTGIGFANVARTEGALLAGPLATQDGRMAILAWHNGVLFSVPEQPSSQPGSNFQTRMWNLTDPTQPRLIVSTPPANAQGSLGTTPQPINAHGYLHLGQNMQTGTPGHFLVLGADWPPEAPWSFRAQSGVPGVTRQASGNLGAGIRSDLFQPWYAGQTWWSYNAVGGQAEIRFGGAAFNPGSQLLATFDHLGATGVVGHPFILGNLLIYASDQSRTGVATYDISDPTQPLLLDVLTVGGPGGYWPELWGNDGELYIVFPYNNNGNGMRVVDATDPAALRFVGDTPLPSPNGSSGAMYAQFQDEYGFIGDHKIDMRTRQSVRQFATIANDIDMSQFALPVGNLLVTGGVGDSQGIAIFAHQAAADTRPPSVAFHIPRAGQQGYPRGAPISLVIHETLDTLSISNGSSLLLRRVLGPGNYGSAVPARWVFSFDDVMTFTPNAPLDADATYEMRVDGIRDAAGNAMPPYAFTFSTGNASGGNRPPQITAFSATPYPVAPGADVDFSAAATDPDGDALQYRFDFGDGAPRTNWGASTTIERAYAAPGHYRASVQARDPAGVIASRNFTVTVLNAPVGARPTQSAPILCDSGNRRIWTVNPDSNTVSALHADSLAKLAEFPVCADPRSVARSAAGELWIACHDDDRLRVLNETTGATLADIDVGYGSGPVGVAISPDGARAFVTLANRGELRRYVTATRQQNASLALGREPRAIAVSADGSRAYVTRFLSPAHHGEVWEVDANTMQLVRALRIPKFGDEANRDTPASGRGVANYLASVALSPLSGEAFIAANKPNSERGLLIHPSQDLDEDNSVRNLLAQLDPDAASPAQRFRRGIDLDNSDSASAVAFSPLGDYLLVTLQGMNEVLVLDALALDDNAGLGAQVTRLQAGAAPQGVCVDAPTGRSFVHDFLDRGVSVLETSDLFGEGSIQVSRQAVSMVANELLASDVLTGKRLFYDAGDPRMSAEGYISCATCHVDGGEDGRVWDFSGRGEGLRNTTTLNGRSGVAHGNVHWSGNFDEIQDFENDIRMFFGGDGFMDDADFFATEAPLGAPKAGRSTTLDALAAYVASLGQQSTRRSPFRAADGSMTADGVAGEVVFQREGCATCHAPPRFTDSGADTLRNVGTLRASSGLRLGQPLTGIDTPTLRGVWASAPYFHDGSAATLPDVFRVTGGTTRPAELAQLAGGASITTGFVDLNNDDTVRGRAYAQIESAGEAIVFNGVDGGGGGLGTIEVRYSNSRATPQTQALTVRVNGNALPGVLLPASDNDPNWRSTNWSTFRIENVPLNAGAGNTVELSTGSWYVSVDEILVAHAGNLAQAQPHRRVLALPQNEQDQLLAFLRQLDASATPLEAQLVFGDGFESIP